MCFIDLSLCETWIIDKHRHSSHSQMPFFCYLKHISESGFVDCEMNEAKYVYTSIYPFVTLLGMSVLLPVRLNCF